MHFNDFLKQSAKEIDTEIENYLSSWSNNVTQDTPHIKPLLEAFEQSVKSGKRIRGSLVLLGFKLPSLSRPFVYTSDDNKSKELLKIAVAYELFQTAILIHDDIIDKSPTRRGIPSVYRALGGEHYGISQAICLGDIGFFHAYKLIAESNFEDAVKSKAAAFFSKCSTETVIGEMLDVDLAYTKREVTEADTLVVSRIKTAYYTFVGPLTLGAILGGADETLLAKIKEFGENTGIAFQLQDDIRDSFGSEKSLKKQSGGDIREGKKTLLYLKAKANADKNQREILQNNYGKSDLSADEIESIKTIFQNTGALEYTDSLSKQYSEKARECISGMTSEKQMLGMLEELLDYVVVGGGK